MSKEHRKRSFDISMLQKIAEKRKQEEDRNILVEKDVKNHIEVMGRLFASEDGMFFLNKLKRACGVDTIDKEINPAKLIEDLGRRKVWYELIHPFLKRKILKELE